MSQITINDIQLEIDTGDVEFLERVDDAMPRLEEQARNISRVGKISTIMKEYCMIYYNLFDYLFGDGTGEQIFRGRMNKRECENAYEELLKAIKEDREAQRTEENEFIKRVNNISGKNKQQPNRQYYSQAYGNGKRKH